MAEPSQGRIFISYRRQETAWPARQLYEVLVSRFGVESVFKDVDDIDPGDDFVEQITAAVTSCDVLLALIGNQWLTMTDDQGRRRLDNPEDFVRLELAAALGRGVRVIPILVDGAPMPRPEQLPPDLVPLTRRQAVEISPIGFNTDRLLATLSATLQASQGALARAGSRSGRTPAGTGGASRLARWFGVCGSDIRAGAGGASRFVRWFGRGSGGAIGAGAGGGSGFVGWFGRGSGGAIGAGAGGAAFRPLSLPKRQRNVSR